MYCFGIMMAMGGWVYMEGVDPKLPKVGGVSELSAKKGFLGWGTRNVRLRHPKQIARLMAKTISQVRRGELHNKIGMAISSLARVALQALLAEGKADEIKKIRGQTYRIRRLVEVEPVPSSPAVTSDDAQRKQDNTSSPPLSESLR